MGRVSLVIAALAACNGSEGGGDDGPGPTEPGDTPAEVLANAFGGREALEALTGFSYDATGSRYILGQGGSPGEGALLASDFELVVSDDRVTNSFEYSWNRLRAGASIAAYDETCVKRLGVVDGIDILLFATSTGDMPSSRWAAVTKQHRMLNPHLIALDALADPTLATLEPTESIGNVTYDVVRFADAVAPMDFLIDSSTGTLSLLRTVENDHLLRDVPLEVGYERWKTYDEEVAFPRELTLQLAGETLHVEERTSIQVNPDLPDDQFEFTDGADPEYDAELADFGERSSQYHEQGTSSGIVLDEPQLYVAALPIEPGVDLLVGSTHNSLVVEQANGIVVIESPLYPERGEAVLDWIASSYPGLPITHVVVTHHHSDHMGGVRAMIAAGATVVVSEQTVDLLTTVWSVPSTIVPDMLSAATLVPEVLPVPDDGSITLPDPVHPITAWQLDSSHASDSLVVQIGVADGENVVFNSDLFLPGAGAFFVPWAEQLKEFIDEHIGGEPIQAGGHGGFGPYSELAELVE
jgi:glyoxylase-like metal-dependent hydrolase (beta-lactamase superfamily II)